MLLLLALSPEHVILKTKPGSEVSKPRHIHEIGLLCRNHALVVVFVYDNEPFYHDDVDDGIAQSGISVHIVVFGQTVLFCVCKPRQCPAENKFVIESVIDKFLKKSKIELRKRFLRQIRFPCNIGICLPRKFEFNLFFDGTVS